MCDPRRKGLKIDEPLGMTTFGFQFSQRRKIAENCHGADNRPGRVSDWRRRAYDESALGGIPVRVHSWKIDFWQGPRLSIRDRRLKRLGQAERQGTYIGGLPRQGLETQ